MEFWRLWFIGWVIVLVTRIAINCFCRETHNTYDSNKVVRIIINLLIIICIVIVGGFIVVKVIGIWVPGDIYSLTTEDISSLTPCDKAWGFVLLGILLIGVSGMTYVVGYKILGLYHLNKYYNIQVLSIVVFILSIIGWFITIRHYNQNFETNTKIIVETVEKRRLLYFGNIPVQEISGNVPYLGYGEITTSDDLPYWYLDFNGEGVFDSASAKASKISFIDGNQSPYVKIVGYALKSTTKNHNNGTEETTTEKTWKEYTFYLPSDIMQYNLN